VLCAWWPAGQVTFKPRADIEFGDSAVLSSVTDVYNLWQQVDASKQGDCPKQRGGVNGLFIWGCVWHCMS